MSPRDVFAAVLAASIWGLTFIFIKLGVEAAPPFTLVALRFAAAGVPLVFFVRPPKAPWRLVVAYGGLIGIAQFGLLFTAISAGMPAGLASLVIQVQVYFTLAFAALVFGERPTAMQAVGALIALVGMALVGSMRAQAGLLPFGLTLCAAACWGGGNVVGKRIGRVDPLALVAWSSLVVPVPMLALSYALEPARTITALAHPSVTLLVSVFALAYGGTLFSYGTWARLMSRYRAGAVAPFALLVPIVGMTATWLLFGETPRALEWTGAGLVMAGLAVNVFGARLGGVWRRLLASASI